MKNLLVSQMREQTIVRIINVVESVYTLISNVYYIIDVKYNTLPQTIQSKKQQKKHTHPKHQQNHRERKRKRQTYTKQQKKNIKQQQEFVVCFTSINRQC